jgi:hypothetical protein
MKMREDMHAEGKIGQEDMKEPMVDVVNRTRPRGPAAKPFSESVPGARRTLSGKQPHSLVRQDTARDRDRHEWSFRGDIGA